MQTGNQTSDLPITRCWLHRWSTATPVIIIIIIIIIIIKFVLLIKSVNPHLRTFSNKLFLLLTVSTNLYILCFHLVWLWLSCVCWCTVLLLLYICHFQLLVTVEMMFYTIFYVPLIPVQWKTCILSFRRRKCFFLQLLNIFFLRGKKNFSLSR